MKARLTTGPFLLSAFQRLTVDRALVMFDAIACTYAMHVETCFTLAC